MAVSVRGDVTARSFMSSVRALWLFAISVYNMSKHLLNVYVKSII